MGNEVSGQPYASCELDVVWSLNLMLRMTAYGDFRLDIPVGDRHEIFTIGHCSSRSGMQFAIALVDFVPCLALLLPPHSTGVAITSKAKQVKQDALVIAGISLFKFSI